MADLLELTLLGRIHIAHNGTPVTGFVSTKAQALLCYLAVTGTTHSRDELASLLWSDMPEKEARANLRVVLFNLRQLVEPHLSVDRQAVALNQQRDYWVDVTDFQVGYQRAVAAETEDALASLTRAVELYRGDLMEGLCVRNAPVFEEWLLWQRESLRQLGSQALFLLATHQTECREYATAMRLINRMLAMEPWNEEAQRQLMLLLALSGRRSAALAQYETCCRVLEHELRLEPTPETTELYQRIRAGEALLPSAPAANPPVIRVSPPAPLQLTPLPFVGRDEEFARLARQWKSVQRGSGTCTLIAGEPGVGKTRLLEEVSHHVAERGAMLLYGQCHPFEHAVPYHPLVQVLRDMFRTTPSVVQALPEYWLIELAQLLPELREGCSSVPMLPAIHDEAGRQRLFEAVAYLFASLSRDGQPVVLLLDDLHHSDSATIDLLRYLLHRLQGTAFWCVGAYRSDEVNPTSSAMGGQGASLLRLCHDLGRMQRIMRLHLEPLRKSAITQLVEMLSGLDAAQVQHLATHLWHESEGNAFILTQLIQHFEEHDILYVVDNRWCLHSQRLAAECSNIPPSVQALILGRISRLPAHARDVLHIATAIGRTFDLRLLTLASVQQPHEVHESLALLSTWGLVRHVSPTCLQQKAVHAPPWSVLPSISLAAPEVQYEFSHDMVRRVIDANFSQGYRQHLHRQIALAASHLQRGPILN